jgi:hypothetical protein
LLVSVVIIISISLFLKISWFEATPFAKDEIFILHLKVGHFGFALFYIFGDWFIFNLFALIFNHFFMCLYILFEIETVKVLFFWWATRCLLCYLCNTDT